MANQIIEVTGDLPKVYIKEKEFSKKVIQITHKKHSDAMFEFQLNNER